MQELLLGLGVTRHYWPERLEVLAELPRTASGKIQKFQLRALLQEEAAPPPSVPAPAPSAEGAPVR